MTIDIRSLLAILTGRAPPPIEPRALMHLLGLAKHHYVYGRLIAVLQDAEIDLPEDQQRLLAEICEDQHRKDTSQHLKIRYEIDRIARATTTLQCPIILLKGAAYVLLNLQAAKGRQISDVDILCRPADISQVEETFYHAGWRLHPQIADDYDADYYRNYMHELPPLQHKERRTVLDIHHDLLPKTGKRSVAVAEMVENAVPVGAQNLYVLDPKDRLIHAAIHLFYDAEFDYGIRGLVEIFNLYSDLEEADKQALMPRAEALGIGEVIGFIYWALQSIHQIESLPKSWSAAPRPNSVVRTAMLHKMQGGVGRYPARLYLYLRGHLMRMPLKMVTKHLLKKLLS